MKKYPVWLLGSVTVAISLVTCLLLAEMALRFLPVASGMRTLPVTAEHPVLRFTPNRDFVFSRDWDMVLANRGRVNNAGFVNDQEYHKDEKLPLLAIIGDSMIEAAMLPYRDTLHGRLADALAGRSRVYSFAGAGAPLSQYLIWARHAVREYGARALVISVISNDYDESHAAYKTGPGFWHYVPDAHGELQLRLFEYHPGWMRKAVLRSALARYLVFNMQLGQRWLELKSWLTGEAIVAGFREGATASDPDEERTRDSIAAVDAFLRDLPSYVDLPPSRILFMVEGFRYADAAAAAAGTYFDRVRRALLEKTVALGYEAIDLDPPFFEHHRRTGEPVELPRDGHWSATYHGVAFEAVMASRFMARVAPEPDGAAKAAGRTLASYFPNSDVSWRWSNDRLAPDVRLDQPNGRNLFSGP